MTNNTLKLTAEDYHYIMTHQDRLDTTIRKQFHFDTEEWDYSLTPNHELALKVEMAELVNSCHDVWKYWKTKPVQMDKILDEAIDVIHFCVLQINKVSKQYKNHPMVDGTKRTVDNKIDEMVGADVEINVNINADFHLFMHSYLHHYSDPDEILAKTLIILNHYGFTRQKVLAGYDSKNQTNHNRVRSGY